MRATVVAIASLLLVVGCGQAKPAATPEQAYVTSFNSIAFGKEAKTKAEKAFIVRAGHAFCTASKHGATDAQAANDLTAVGVTSADLAKTVRLAAQSRGSLCPV